MKRSPRGSEGVFSSFDTFIPFFLRKTLSVAPEEWDCGDKAHNPYEYLLNLFWANQILGLGVS